MKKEVIKIMLGWIETNEPIETTADKLLDLFGVNGQLLFAFIAEVKKEFADQNWDYLDFIAERFFKTDKETEIIDEYMKFAKKYYPNKKQIPF